jgi:hypothetical protein
MSTKLRSAGQYTGSYPILVQHHCSNGDETATTEPGPPRASHGMRYCRRSGSAAGRMDQSPIRRILRRASAWLLVCTALALTLESGVAGAATNGQQVYVYGSAQYSVTVCGTNQNNNYVCGHANTPTYIPYLPGWWWKGSVKIYNYGASGNYLGLSTCYVPTSQSANWVGCHGWG